MNPLLPRVLMSLLLTACTGPSKTPLPDGRNRHPINNAASISAYHKELATIEDPKQVPATEMRIIQLEARLAALNAALSKPPAAMPNAVDAAEPLPPAANSPQPCTTNGLAANETLQCRSRSILFSFAFTTGASRFHPSPALQALLMRAVGDSRRIEVRGRTDGDFFTHSGRQLALRRATSARAFLLRQGFPAANVHATALASGAHTAENITPAGKARNRRVDIEVMDVDPLPYLIANHLFKGE